jgi:hypothetical protein
VTHNRRHPGLVPGSTVTRILPASRAQDGGPRHKAGVTEEGGKRLSPRDGRGRYFATTGSNTALAPAAPCSIVTVAFL